MVFVLTHRTATTADLALLAQMNQQLIEDERHRNPMTLSELEMRMRSMLEGDYTATLFTFDGQIVAYALWRLEPEWIYLRQFFVARGFRRRGVGREAIRLLVNQVWPENTRVRVNALVGNRPALEFWRAVGFADYLITLEMDRTR
ncbi:MAG: GNAT family N-acetyltransferase [Chloroflexi bacterium]|nr:GNAT family N-acetyltransferase [Chloroflexota bacterium]